MNFHGFLGHLVAGGVLAALGMWHTLNTIVSYRVEGPSGFRAATWFPFPWPRLKHLELHILLSFSVLAAVDQVLGGGSPLPDRLAHATMYLLLAAYAWGAFAADSRLGLATTSDHVVALRGDAVATLAASVFALELFLLHRYDTGGESVYYWVLKLAAGACFAASSATIVMPWSFAAAVVQSASVTFQGLWLVVMALWLWVPFLRQPWGCGRASIRYARCPNGHKESEMVIARVHYQFTLVLAAIWVGTVYLCTRPVEDDAQSYQKRVARIMPMVEQRVESLVLDLQQRYVAAVLEAKDFLLQLKNVAGNDRTGMLKNDDDEEAPMLKNADDLEAPMLKNADHEEAPMLKNADDEEAPMLKNSDDLEAPMLKNADHEEAPMLKNADDEEAPMLKNADEKAPPILEQAADVEKGVVPPVCKVHEMS